MRRTLFVALLLSLITPLTLADQFVSQRTADLPYRETGDPRHTLDVYIPQDAPAPHPTIFLVHGGGYLFGNKETVRDAAQHFASLGYAVIAPNYRLAPDNTYPSQIQDVFCALAWTVAHAEEYSIDSSRMVFMGESAGANAASLLATIDGDERQPYLADCAYTLPDEIGPLASVLYYIPFELASCDCTLAKRMAAAYFGVPDEVALNPENLRELWSEASPHAWLDADDAPFLLLHGTRDNLIPISESQAFVEAANRIGVDAQLIPVEGGNHGFFTAFRSRPNQRALPTTEAFLEAIFATTPTN